MAARTLFTAVLACGSGSALPVWLEAERAGLRVPDDCSIATINDLDWWHSGIALDGMQHPAEAMGVAAVAMLERKIAAPERRVKARSIPFTPHEIGTTGVPP